MPSLEGLKTWLEYEMLFTGLLIAAVLAYFGATVLLDAIAAVPLTAGEIVATVVVAWVLVVGIAYLVTARLG